MKRFFITLIACTLLMGAFAQDKMLSVSDVAYNRALYPANKSFKWLPSGTKLSTVEKIDGISSVLVKDINGGTTDTAFNLEDLNQAIEDKHFDFQLERFPNYSWVDDYTIKFKRKGVYYTFNGLINSILIDGSVGNRGQIREVHTPTYNTAYIKQDNIVIKTEDFERKITYDGGGGIVYGEAVHRNEFGIHKGLFWSPEGKKLAFYRMDERRVTDYPIYDLSTNPASHYNIKYPTAGDSSHTVKLGIYDTEESTIIYLDTDGPYDQYLTNITWSPEGDLVYIAWLNRAQNHMKLQCYDVVKGNLVKTLFEEKNDKYVEPEHGPIFLENNTKNFVWFSERDGYNHLYLYNTKGKEISQLTSGKWIVTEVLGFDESESNIFFMGTKDSPLERHLYKVNLKNKSITRLTRNAGTHRITANPQMTYFLDEYSSLTVPRIKRIIDGYGNISQELFKADNPLKEYKIGSIEINPLIQGKNVLYHRMVKPPNFNPNKKYPVIVYLYGGPHAQMINNRWLGGSRMEFLYWAQQGYIVYTIDNRGSANRGFAFESAVHRQLGTLEMEDQMAGVKYLKKLPFVDQNRMGIHGWSFGGFMTTSMMSRNPGVFKAGVAGGPVIDWDYYEIMYTERYMDSPKENPDGYKNSNLLNHIDNLEGRLLMIHGTDDDVVLWQHSMLYMQKAVDKGKLNLDYYIYPKHKHNVRGKDRIHLIGKISQYLFEHI